MERNHLKKPLILVVALGILASCHGALPAVPDPVSVTFTPTTFASATILPSLIPTAIPTPTPVPTATFTPPTLTPDTSVPDRYEQAHRLGRGVNLGNALEAPVEGEWGMVLHEEYFQLIATAQFDTVRVPIRWSAHALSSPPYTINQEFFERVDWVIQQALDNNLNVVINMHHYDEFFEAPAEHQDRFISMWSSIAKRYKATPAQVYFELLNEPHGNLSQTRWEQIMTDTVQAIRRIDNRHTLIVGGAEWGGVTGLLKMHLPEGENNIICTFHFYDPMLFTHQGTEWTSVDYSTLGVTWPGPPKTEVEINPEAAKVAWVDTWFSQYNSLPTESNPAGPRPIKTTFNWAQQARERLDCPIWLGEFGAYDKADMASRVNWTTFVRELAESLEIPWAYWEFGAGFGIYDRDLQQWHTELLKALIPD